MILEKQRFFNQNNQRLNNIIYQEIVCLLLFSFLFTVILFLFQ